MKSDPTRLNFKDKSETMSSSGEHDMKQCHLCSKYDVIAQCLGPGEEIELEHSAK